MINTLSFQNKIIILIIISAVVSVLLIQVNRQHSHTIGVLLQPLYIKGQFTGNQYVWDVYIKFLQKYGFEFVLIPYQIEKTKLMNLLDCCDGVILTGGELSLLNSHDKNETAYLRSALFCIEYAKFHPNFILTGICQGIQLLFAYLTGEKNFYSIQARNVITDLKIIDTNNIFPLRFHEIPKLVFHNHSIGIPLQLAYNHSQITPICHNWIDKKNILTCFSYCKNIYGFQFHPELADIYQEMEIPQSEDAREIQQIYVNLLLRGNNGRNKQTLQDKYLNLLTLQDMQLKELSDDYQFFVYMCHSSKF